MTNAGETRGGSASTAFLFPGQGSQSVGMLAAHMKKHPVIRETFEQASEVLSENLLKLVSEGPEQTLNLTVNTQPSVLAASVGIWRLWNSLGGGPPAAMSGHSLGEYSALTCAGVFAFEDAVKVVRTRARLMQAAVPAGHGTMAVVLGLDTGRVTELCAESCTGTGAGETLEAVNFNTATQIVVAGHITAVDRLIKLAQAAGARRCVPLPVSVPAHSSLMRTAAEEFADFLSGMPMQKPDVPVLHNTDAASHDDTGKIREALAAQMHRPVQWLQIIKHLTGGGKNNGCARTLIEIGPGRVLTGLNRSIDKSLKAYSSDTPESLEKALSGLPA